MTMKNLDDWKKQSEKKRPSDKTLLGYWVRMYELASGRPCTINFTPNTIISFNSVIKSVRNVSSSNDEEIRLAILFGYTHDPLSLGDPMKYGDIAYIYKLVSSYRSWCKMHKLTDTPPYWQRKKILETMDISTSELLTTYMKELIGAV